MDDDDPSVFERTVDWALRQGIHTATFHILTPYPGTRLHRRLTDEGRITSTDWDRYDTRHSVFTPARMSAETLEAGYWRVYKDFYCWRSIGRSAWAQPGARERLRHLLYTTGWKKLEPVWDLAMRTHRVHQFLPLLEAILDRFEGSRESGRAPETGPTLAPFRETRSALLVRRRVLTPCGPSSPVHAPVEDAISRPSEPA
jgi:Domain of unknown function (DUF4070)